MTTIQQFDNMVLALRTALANCEVVQPQYAAIVLATTQAAQTFTTQTNVYAEQVAALQDQIETLTRTVEEKRTAMAELEGSHVRRLQEAQTRADAAQDQADTVQRDTAASIQALREEHERLASSLVQERTALQQEITTYQQSLAAFKRTLHEIEV